jgi:hypothetical protein
VLMSQFFHDGGEGLHRELEGCVLKAFASLTLEGKSVCACACAC